MHIDKNLTVTQLDAALRQFFALACEKTRILHEEWDPADGSPVVTRQGKYSARGWTEWTQGFQFGIPILAFDATGDEEMLTLGRDGALRYMPAHVSHIGVHDHGFNNISTYGNLRRLALESRTSDSQDALKLYELALKISGAIQAVRWTTIHDGSGFIYSFNGPHSLFSDTIRSCRSLVLAHKLGHYLLIENDVRVSLLQRAVEHMLNTSMHNVYFGDHRDIYDESGRVAHESVFNQTDGQYRCPSTQQGYTPFSTWTRGLAWIILGYAEELECLDTLADDELTQWGGRAELDALLVKTATVTADFYIANTAVDGIPYWDTGAPGLVHMPNWRTEPAHIDNAWEPVDSSAAAIAAQGLLRLGHRLGRTTVEGKKYWQAGLTVAQTLFSAPYLSEDVDHHGLLLHSIYHRPRGWDYTPHGRKVPQGESSMWGDYHAMELAVYLQRILNDSPYLTFFYK